ncbi:MAG: DUF2723 domain-containing protein [Gemmatimonadota bacterium]|nr:DUF2723 domain-containing protein [Gemmatimonadota bacterium]
MRTISRERVLYAALTFLLVFGSYLWTLAPTLTFWDAGEFIATSYILGIPHPPGTPLFVLIGHVFGMLPLGVDFAVKLNLMSALASSTAGLFFFLVLAQVLDRIDRDRGWELSTTVVNVAALAAVCLASWGLTMWYNSTETEVYTIALMTIGLVTFLAFWWADHLEQGKDWNLLLLIVFLMGLSIGNHLMALLVMPAVVVYAVTVVWSSYRDYVLSLLLGAAGLYIVTMRGVSVDGILGGGAWIDGVPMVLGLVVLGTAIWWMNRTGALPFFGAAILAFVAGASVLLFLKIRAGMDPAINEANPETWSELLAVLARKQYNVRPVFPRSVDFLQYQIPLYFDYLFGRVGPFESRVPGQFGVPGLSILVFLMAIVGSVYHWLADRKTWVFFLFVYLATSLGLIVYLNFPLGNTQAPEVTGLMREVRERDYFFVVSFVFLGLWAGVGVFAVVGEAVRRWAEERARQAPTVAVLIALLLVPATVFALNFHRADRRGNWVPRDFAYNVLQSLEPWAIVFTNGDNDTFPLWYLQEVEGVRRDVTIVNLALLNTGWYIRQLSERTFTASDPPREMPSFPLGEVAGVEPGPRPTRAILGYTGRPDHPLSRPGYVIDEETSLEVAGIPITLEANTVLRRQDVGVLQVIRRHLGDRPVYFSVTVPGSGQLGLGEHLVRHGVVDLLHRSPASELARRGLPIMPMQPPEEAWLHVPRTEALLEEVYRYRGILDPSVYKDGTARALIGNYGATYLQLAAAQARRGQVEEALEAHRRGTKILGRDPTAESSLTGLINIFAVSGSFERLDSLFRTLEQRRGGSLDARYYKTAAYNAAVAGRFEFAQRVLREYFQETPRAVEPELWIEMAEMALATGDTSRALRLLEGAMESDPDSRRAFLRSINLAEAIGEGAAVRGFLRRWVETHPGDTAATRLYERYLETGELPAELSAGPRRRPVQPVDTLPTGG